EARGPKAATSGLVASRQPSGSALARTRPARMTLFMIRSELPPDCHWKEPLRSAAAAEETEIVRRDQEPGLCLPIPDADTGAKPHGQRIGSWFSIYEPTHAWAKAEKPRCNRHALRRLNGRGQGQSSRGPGERGAAHGRRGQTGRKDGAGGLGHRLD